VTKYQNYTGMFITTGQYISLEMKRHIENTETPGKYGYFGATDNAAGDAE
jgi:hypothetical protein